MVTGSVLLPLIYGHERDTFLDDTYGRGSRLQILALAALHIGHVNGL
jgi:hypothetical protein